jgi:hypothetical protein
MATVVYLLCAVTSIACAALLLAAYRRSGARLLLWTFLCFAWLSINNVLLVVDLALIRDVDLSILRVATALAGLVILLYGLIYDTGRGDQR